MLVPNSACLTIKNLQNLQFHYSHEHFLGTHYLANADLLLFASPRERFSIFFNFSSVDAHRFNWSPRRGTGAAASWLTHLLTAPLARHWRNHFRACGCLMDFHWTYIVHTANGPADGHWLTAPVANRWRATGVAAYAMWLIESVRVHIVFF
jgi:hypothetical protein